ncbi:hypothetical protein NB647_04860 [Oxalobacter aliiformigenes]|uniref:hypothetical protein n=1 Tax=Oxalobacter aliiformigenes TaxID=2946593 RepID=UPI0022AFD1A8|nr:hypothetical protein [Oxalobacter aliiformigenes]WAV90126.1 hypothetical protein NB647_04860 [Oxalobacter aliiformigenes]
MKRIAGIVGGEGAMKGRWADRPEWGTACGGDGRSPNALFGEMCCTGERNVLPEECAKRAGACGFRVCRRRSDIYSLLSG